jgi:2-(1,2-epoxy-1,2-dihydrophenyl)acetyl-CoA isomerase
MTLLRPHPAGQVEVEVADRVATVRLDRPASGNALDVPLARRLAEVLVRVAADDGVRALILTGSGHLFCAGEDLRAIASASDRHAYLGELADVLHGVQDTLRELPMPIVAAVNGSAVGAGLGLVLSADIAVASRDARFQCGYGDMGLTPDCGVSVLLPRVIGVRRAALLSLTGQSLGAAQALEWQLITDVCDPAALLERAAETATHLVSRASPATGETARLLRASWSSADPELLRDEARTIARTSMSAAADAAIERFVREAG